MPWTHLQSEINGKPASSLLETRFAERTPNEQLPSLAWFGVYCCEPPSGGFSNPAEGPALDAIEKDLIRLCGVFGNGWAIYVRRLETPGIREYYVYYGGNADMGKVLPALKGIHKGYRIEFGNQADPTWSQYKSWIQTMKGNG